MAGSSSPAPTRLHAPASRTSCPTPLSLSESWRASRPFAVLSAEARLDYLREYGMHGEASAFRVGIDAFEIRGDIEVGDACETAAQLLKALIGSLDMLAIAPDTSSSRSHAVAGCALLAKQVGGALAVIAAGVFPGHPTDSASNDV